MTNPYAAPSASPSAPGHTYVPLGLRTTFAILGVIAVVVTSLALHALQASFGPAATDPTGVAIIFVGLAALVSLGALVGGAVCFFIWLHRAFSNLRGLGRVGMRSTPGWAIGGFFVPIGNLFMPFASMKELWQASDPKAVQGSWFDSESTPLLGVWWAGWIVGGIVGTFAIFLPVDASGAATLGFVADFARAISAVAIVLIMRGIDARQEQAAAARMPTA